MGRKPVCQHVRLEVCQTAKTIAIRFLLYSFRIPTLIFVLATDKVALLIGNLNYSSHPKLMAPVMDVHELANLLQQLGFRVVSLLDLTREEMQAAIQKFIELLDRGVYGKWSLLYLSVDLDFQIVRRNSHT